MGKLRVREYLPDFRDLHVYGGVLLVAVGAGAMWGWPAGVALIGTALVYLGIRGV